MSPHTRHQLWVLAPHGALFLVSLFYGAFAVVMRLLLQDVAPEPVVVLRVVITALVLGLVELLWIRCPINVKEDGLRILAIAVLGVVVLQTMVVFGLSLTTAYHATVCFTTVPIVTAIVQALFFKHRPHLQQWTGIGLGFLGVLLLMSIQSPDTPLPETALLGDLIMLFNSFVFSMYLIWSRPLIQKYNPISLMNYCFIIGALLMLTISALSSLGITFSLPIANAHTFPNLEALSQTMATMSLMDWVYLGYIVIFATVLTFALNNYALVRTTAGVVAIYICLQPIVAAVLGSWWLGELFTTEMAIAGALSMIGVLLTVSPPFQTLFGPKKATPTASA